MTSWPFSFHRRSRAVTRARPARVAFLVVGGLLALAAGETTAQVAPLPTGPAVSDSAASARAARAAVADARDAQTRFERQRRQWSPVARNTWVGGSCDETIGRLCWRFEAGDWWPVPEDLRIVSARVELLSALESFARTDPANRWLVGQRVFYLADGGFWEDAEQVARTCSSGPEWCGALLGFVLHGQQRFAESESAFRAALAEMDDAERRRWNDPELLLDSDGTGYLRSLGAPDGSPRAAAVERIWRLSDPLYLVEGNDRLTEHWSRLTFARLRDDAANPWNLRWARDLEEVLLRYGWEVGWERMQQIGGATDGMIGHDHPEGRTYLPPGRMLDAPVALAVADWPLSPARPREGYAPPYAPVIVPADAEVLRFPRGDRVVVVAAFSTPTDTTDHSRHDHPAFVPLDSRRGDSAQAGLFLVPLDGGPTLEARRSGGSGAVLLEAPTGRYLASAEVWLPERGFAGRTRVGLDAPPTSRLTVSDLILLDQALPDSVPLEGAVAHARAPGPVQTSEEFAVGWEVFGPMDRGEVLSYRLSITGAGAGFFRKVGQWLRLAGREEPVRLSWQDAGPAGGGPRAVFRTLSLQIPQLDPGEYRLRLEVTPRSGPPLATERLIRVTRP